MVRIKDYPALPLRDREIARYAGIPLDEGREMIEEAKALAAGCLSGRVCWETFPCSAQANRLDLGFAVTHSAGLAKNLRGCGSIVLFAATVGPGIDRLTERYRRISPAKALLLHALGAEAVEAVCDRFNAELAGLYPALRPRFSPGYGDLPLELQRDVFRALQPERRIGVTLLDSLMMTPSKSVTAIIGIEERQTV